MIGLSLMSGGCSAVPRASAVVGKTKIVAATTATTQTQALTQSLESSTVVESVEASCPVPVGWVAQPLKQGSNHNHQIWISPSGHTAYGVLFVSLPFPAGFIPVRYRLERVLDGFLGEMKRHEGRADLIERVDVPDQDGIRFVAEGGQYRVHANLLVRGARAWFIYAGTRQNQSLIPAELSIAERARDETKVDVSQ
jgi:hypothetical protein